MAITKTKLLIEISQNINTIATAVQLDGNSRFLDVCLHDKGLPIDLTEHVVRIHVRKPDGKTVFNQGEITDAAAGRCQFALTAEMLSEAKELKAQISIWNSDTEILSTNVFKILVTESLRNDEEVEASNEFGVLVVLFTEIQSALELMRELVSAFGEPGEMAETYGVDTFWEMLEHLAAGADVRQVLKENINSTMDTEEFATLDELILRSVVPHGVQEFKASGTFVVPAGVHKIWVSGCGGGSGGSGADSSANDYAGCGGNGGACIIREPFAVTPGQQLSITIGAAGAAGANGSDPTEGSAGGATVVGNLVTLPGGAANTVYDKSDKGNKRLGAGVGGNGGVYHSSSNKTPSENGTDGVRGAGGNGHSTARYGGGGGGSYGSGGDGATNSVAATAPGYGGGGGGGAAYDTSTKASAGGKGYCLIEW